MSCICALPPMEGYSGRYRNVAAAIPAGLHCANNEKFHAAQLVISNNNTNGIIDYLSQVMHYLQMIRPGKL